MKKLLNSLDTKTSQHYCSAHFFESDNFGISLCVFYVFDPAAGLQNNIVTLTVDCIFVVNVNLRQVIGIYHECNCGYRLELLLI